MINSLEIMLSVSMYHQKSINYLKQPIFYKNLSKTFNLCRKYKKDYNSIYKEKGKYFQDFISYQTMNCYKFYLNLEAYKWSNKTSVNAFRLWWNSIWPMVSLLLKVTWFRECTVLKNKELFLKAWCQPKTMYKYG